MSAASAPLTSTAAALVIEARFGHPESVMERVERLIPAWGELSESEPLMLAQVARAIAVHRLQGSAESIAVCDTLHELAQAEENSGWIATACALRARFRIDSGVARDATADLAQARVQLPAPELDPHSEFLLMHTLATVYHRLRMHERANEARERLEFGMSQRPAVQQAVHWAAWANELCSRAIEPLAADAGEPDAMLLEEAVRIAAQVATLPAQEIPEQLIRSAAGVRAVAAALDGRPTEALRLLGRDAFSVPRDLSATATQMVCLAAMRAHALVGSIPTARSLDDAAASSPALMHLLVLEVVRTRERLWLETYAEGDAHTVLLRLTDLLVKLSWAGMEQVADAAGQALEHQALRAESRTDALTGVGNRRSMDEELNQLLRFSPLPMSLVLVDIDRFKEINDRFTHVVGDQVLRRVANTLGKHLRTGDRLLRFGGDEFVVLLPGTGEEEATRVAGRMREAIAADDWTSLAEKLAVTATTGCSTAWSLTGRRPETDAELLFLRADEQLLQAKRAQNPKTKRQSLGTTSLSVFEITAREAAARLPLPSQTPVSNLSARAAFFAEQPARDLATSKPEPAPEPEPKPELEPPAARTAEPVLTAEPFLRDEEYPHAAPLGARPLLEAAWESASLSGLPQRQPMSDDTDPLLQLMQRAATDEPDTPLPLVVEVAPGSKDSVAPGYELNQDPLTGPPPPAEVLLAAETSLAPETVLPQDTGTLPPRREPVAASSPPSTASIPKPDTQGWKAHQVSEDRALPPLLSPLPRSYAMRAITRPGLTILPPSGNELPSRRSLREPEPTRWSEPPTSSVQAQPSGFPAVIDLSDRRLVERPTGRRSAGGEPDMPPRRSQRAQEASRRFSPQDWTDGGS